MEKIAIGNIRTSHGVKGYMKVRSFSGELEHFLKLKEVALRKDSREIFFNVEDIKKQSAGLLIKLEKINSPEEAKKYANWEIWVDRKNAAPLSRGEFYSSDLNDCSLVYNGEALGTVKAVCDGGIYDLLEVEKTDGKTVMVPFHKEYLGKIDIKTRKIELKVDWILE